MTILQTTSGSNSTVVPSIWVVILRFLMAVVESTKKTGGQVGTSFWAYTEANGKGDTSSFNGLL